MPKPSLNPVEYTFAHPSHNTRSSTDTSSPNHPLPYPDPISSRTYLIAGIQTTVFGLSELPPSTHEVSVLWLLHPRLQTQECMIPFASHILRSWTAAHHSSSHKNKRKRGLIAVSFDQRNHGTRLVNAVANEAWRGGNETHAQDMFSSYAGSALDTSLLLDYLTSYIFPDGQVEITQNIVLGISLGGYAAWQVVMQDHRFDGAVVTIGCPDYVRLMADRARLSKRKSWLDGAGERFLGSTDFPRGLLETVKRIDPAALVGSVFGREGWEDGEISKEEKEGLMPLMKKWFGNKKILNLSVEGDKLVPYKQSEPFLKWLRKISRKGGWFADGGLEFEDVIIAGARHEVPPEMVGYMVRFVNDNVPGETEAVRIRRESKESRI